ncbi:hypothetical protein IWQ60_011526 [Tieghemiomyces parasiticus]|uniref:Zn(2)-C6 fungal-type domain-containing protein n=1 Tax=Tieghemiomyces parasiticus TaxID=78921 RepID=A0A9W7ZJB7_9FUNG|nr:hypothetical protein IWQ60_011526 [Tieghemiomyces parasiticus]
MTEEIERDSPETPLSPGNLPKRRTYACHNCRKRKIKCDMTRPNCNNCTRRNAKCFFAPTPTPKASKKSYIKSLEDRLQKMELLLEPLQAAEGGSPPLGPRHAAGFSGPYYGHSTALSSVGSREPVARHHLPSSSSTSIPPRLPPLDQLGLPLGPIRAEIGGLPSLASMTAQLPASGSPASVPTHLSAPFPLSSVRPSDRSVLTVPLVSITPPTDRPNSWALPTISLDARSVSPLSSGRSLSPSPSELFTRYHSNSVSPVSLPRSSISDRLSPPISPCCSRRLSQLPSPLLAVPSATSPTSSVQTSLEINHSMVMDYFDYFHPHIPFIHKATFLRDLHRGQVYPPVLYTVYAIAIRASKHPSAVIEGIAQMALRYQKRARDILQDDYTRPTVEVVMAFILATLTEVMCGDQYRASQHHRLTIDMARSLQFHLIDQAPTIPVLEHATDPAALRERIRRLWWVCVCIDTFVAKSSNLRPLLPDGEINLRLPCPDAQWEAAVFTEEPVPESALKVYDGFRQHLTLVLTSRRLLNFKADVSEGRFTQPEVLLSAYHDFRRHIDAWHTEHNKAVSQSPQPFTTMGRVWYLSNQIYLNSNLVAMYLVFYQRPDGSEVSPDFRRYAQERCIAIAVDTAKLLNHNQDILPTQLVGHSPIELAYITQVCGNVIRHMPPSPEFDRIHRYMDIIKNYLMKCTYWNLAQYGGVGEIGGR